MTETKPFKAADYLRDEASIEGLVRYAARLEIENERLRKALSYYADEAVWDDDGDRENDTCRAWRNGGKVAREALGS